MYFLFTLDSHDVFGPFMSRGKAHEWAYETSKMSYQVLTDTYCQQKMLSYPINKPY